MADEDSFRQYRNQSQVETSESEPDTDSENTDFYDIDVTLNPNAPRGRFESTRIDPPISVSPPTNIENQQQVEAPLPPPTGRSSNVSVNVEPLIEVLNPVQPPPRTRSTGPVQIISYGGYIPPPTIGDERPKRVKKTAQQLFDERQSEKRTTDARRAEDRERILRTEYRLLQRPALTTSKDKYNQALELLNMSTEQENVRSKKKKVNPFKITPEMIEQNPNMTLAEWKTRYDENLAKDEGGGENQTEEEEEEEEDDTRSQTSQGSLNDRAKAGLSGVLTHIVKPVSAFLDPTTRDNPETVERSRRHLDKVTEKSVSAALRYEPVLQKTLDRMNFLEGSLASLLESNEMLRKEMQGGSQARVLSEKAGRIRPNELYPAPEMLASAAQWTRAVQGMGEKVKIIERVVRLDMNPYEFLVELLSMSNTIAASYGLTMDQQRLLVLSFIPSTHDLYKELSLHSSLTGFFAVATMNSTSILSKTELDQKFEGWKLNLTNMTTLNNSILTLKSILIDLENKDPAKIEQTGLYRNMIKRIKRENLTIYTLRALDDAMYRIELENNEVELHQLLLAPLRDIIIYRERKQMTGNRSRQELAVRVIETGQPYPPPLTDGDANTGAKPKKKPQKQKQKNETANQRGRDQKRDPQKNRDRSQSRPKYTSVDPWPRNKNYLSKDGKNLTPECEAHFKNFCYKCGHSSHGSRTCRIYTNKTPILTLCDMCMSGFHNQCKSYKFKKLQEDANKTKLDQLSNLVNKMSLTNNKEMVSVEYRPPGYPGSPYGMWYPYPPPPALKHTEQSEDEDDV
jgi:hypothetical protein